MHLNKTPKGNYELVFIKPSDGQNLTVTVESTKNKGNTIDKIPMILKGVENMFKQEQPKESTEVLFKYERLDNE